MPHRIVTTVYATLLYTLLLSSHAPAAEPGTHPQWPRDAVHERLLRVAEKSVEDGIARVAGDRFRPSFHVLPASRFMNDPNGCIQFEGMYHVFFQHRPFWGEPDEPTAPGWGHFASRDLVHWQRLPIALMPIPGRYDAAAVASGACVIDDGKPTIVYTSVPPQAQSLARSFDGMRTWHRFSGNPVVAKPPAIPGLEDGFRDPFVWREGDNWRMLVGSGVRNEGGTVLLYESPDLVSWKFLGRLCTGMGADCFQWECPNFFKLGDRWVLIVSPLYHSIPSLRGPVQYSVGKYDGRRFTPGPWHSLDFGGPTQFYAPNSLLDDQGRRILWGWLMGGGGPGSPWDGMLTLPRRLELGPDERLRVQPVKEIDTLRGKQLASITTPRVLSSGETVDVCRGTELDVVMEFKRSSQGRFSAKVFGDALTISYDMATGELRCGDKKGIVPRADSPDREDGTFTMRILVDRSVVEVYADGRETMSLRVHPSEGQDAFQLHVEEGPLTLARLQAWEMKPIEWE